jgi:hypothetical protein
MHAQPERVPARPGVATFFAEGAMDPKEDARRRERIAGAQRERGALESEDESRTAGRAAEAAEGAGRAAPRSAEDLAVDEANARKRGARRAAVERALAERATDEKRERSGSTPTEDVLERAMQESADPERDDADDASRADEPG